MTLEVIDNQYGRLS